MKLSEFMLFALMRNQNTRMRMMAIAIKKKIPQFIGRNIAKVRCSRLNFNPYFIGVPGPRIVLNHLLLQTSFLHCFFSGSKRFLGIKGIYFKMDIYTFIGA
ncbi:MAG: hypothetical protein J6T62_01660 [Fibrobacter sp.]|nr:hypothetical protein [Fibrobacter sp.]